jgi:hypothetical protein
MTGKYDDIINLPRHKSKKRPAMPIKDRAAQFSPFSALTTYEEKIKETARITEKRVYLDKYMIEKLSHKLKTLQAKIEDEIEVSICYFKPDKKKDGGAYITKIAIVKRIDEYNKKILLDDGTVVPMDEIIRIEADIFEELL